jgi:protein gp37
MSENSKIEWTDHTFNPWEGCQKVGPGCDHCYAEARNARFGGGSAPNWGPGAPRRRTSVSNWRKPIAWNAAHAEFFATTGRRQRVFCASLADVFDNAVDPAWRRDLFRLIDETPNLDWLLLTKRIGNAHEMIVEARGLAGFQWYGQANVWLGATIVNQEEADRDIPKLLETPAAVRFLSMEPLLGKTNLTDISDGHADSTIPREYWVDDFDTDDSPPAVGHNTLSGERWQRFGDWRHHGPRIDWVIVGGESGRGARPMHPDWARSLRDQCAAAGVPFLFKQWGEYGFRADLREDVMREFDGPEAPLIDKPAWMQRVGKRVAGRELDGVTHDGFPEGAV